ncbi:MAG: hypothetical protein SFY81_08395 [Verrucomicrobiota bacterium]|nr:hypothetical protein [Verrucomicrobiota bacterium]
MITFERLHSEVTVRLIGRCYRHNVRAGLWQSLLEGSETWKGGVPLSFEGVFVNNSSAHSAQALNFFAQDSAVASVAYK